MDREVLIGKGFTPEQVDEIMAMYGADVKDLKGRVEKAEEKNNSYSELQKKYDNLAKSHKELEEKNMTEAEKQAQALKDLEKQKQDYAILTNEVKAKSVLIGAGISEEEANELVQKIVTEDVEKTLAGANAVVNLYKNTVDITSKKVKDEMLANNPKPPMSNKGGDTGEITQEEFLKMSYSQQMEAINKDPALSKFI